MSIGAASGTLRVASDAGEPLDWCQREALEPLLLARWGVEAPERRLSDPWFANLLLFRDAHDWRFRPGDWPTITGLAYDGSRLVLPLFDPGHASPDCLCDLLAGHDGFGPLSLPQAQAFDPSVFTVREVRDDADYLYPAERFEFVGLAQRAQRNQVHRLLREHRLDAAPYQPSLAAEARVVLDTWMAAKGKGPGEADEVPCMQALAQADRLGLAGYLFRVDDQAVGFVLGQGIGPGVHVIRFAKGRDAFKGLYPAMFQHFCRATPGVLWLNFEQDLGLANLRRTKLSYRPAALLAKLRVTLRDL